MNIQSYAAGVFRLFIAAISLAALSACEMNASVSDSSELFSADARGGIKGRPATPTPLPQNTIAPLPTVAPTIAPTAAPTVTPIAIVPTATPAPGSPADFHAAAVAKFSSMPLRATGTVYYFCECATGAEPGCQQGCDPPGTNGSFATDTGCTNTGRSPSSPFRRWTHAINQFNAMNAGDTIALCKGGLFNVPAASDAAGAGCGYFPHAPGIQNSRCALGTTDLNDPANASTCDIRDYRAPWGGSKKPVLYPESTGPTYLLIRTSGSVTPLSTNGVRILNLEFRGRNPGPIAGLTAAQSLNQWGLVIGACNYAHDDSWLIGNNTFTNLRLGINIPQTELNPSHMNYIGNTFLNNDLDAWLGEAGDHARFDSNLFDNNGGIRPHPVSGNEAHTLYLSGPTPPGESSDVQIVNNQFLRTGAGTTVTATDSPLVVSHEYYDYLNVENNLIDAGPAGTGHAWGIAFGNAVALPYATYYRHSAIRRNKIIARGNGITWGSNPSGIIEDNIIVLNDLPNGNWQVGIHSPDGAAGAYGGADDVANAVTIRNNTLYMMGPAGAYTGILSDTEGTGHVIANNTIYMGAPAGNTCFSTPLAASAYAFIGNNACFGGRWGTAFDATMHITSNPMFTNAPLDFTPALGSPLIGAGNAAYSSVLDFNLRVRPSRPAIGALEP